MTNTTDLLKDAEARVASGDVPDVVQRLHYPHINEDGECTASVIDLMVAAYEAGRLSRADELYRRLGLTVKTLKRVRRKHMLDDDSIGWDELSGEIENTLSEVTEP